MAKTQNKDIIQSYILTTAKYDFSVYEKRILYRIIELNQSLLDGKKLNEKYKISSNLYGDKTYTIPIKYFLKDDKDDNYKEIKKALNRLKKKEIEYEDDKIWASLSIIANPKIIKYSDTVTFTVDSIIDNVLLDFSKGYRKYELEVAMQFDSVYAMRFYELLSGQKRPLTFSIEHIKEMFQITEKYDRVNDFKKYVLNAGKKELDKCSPYSFDYTMNKTGRKFTTVTFYPKSQPKFRDELLETKKLQRQVSLSWNLPKNVIDYLKFNFEFTTEGIKNNIDLLREANNEIDLISFLAELKGRTKTSKNPQGYVIGAIKKIVNTTKHNDIIDYK